MTARRKALRAQKAGARSKYCRGRKADPAFEPLRRSHPLQRRRDKGEQRSVSHDRRGRAINDPADFLEATRASERGVSERFLARRDELEIRPRSFFEGGVLRLRDSRVVRRPLLQTGPL